jgi:catechol 2,3-dioxygenase-like lactoylglutathione lyase family enzyme
MLRVKALDHVRLIVADLDRSLRFYVEGLGLELLRRRDRTEGGSSAVLRVGKQEINLFCNPALAAEGAAVLPQRIDHFCLMVDYRTIGDVVTAVRAAGLEIASGPAATRGSGDWGNPSHWAITGVAVDERRNRTLRRGWREGELRTLPVIRLRRRDQQGRTHIPSGRSATSTDAFPRKVDGFLTRFAILCARKASSESPRWLHVNSRQ